MSTKVFCDICGKLALNINIGNESYSSSIGDKQIQLQFSGLGWKYKPEGCGWCRVDMCKSCLAEVILSIEEDD